MFVLDKLVKIDNLKYDNDKINCPLFTRNNS